MQKGKGIPWHSINSCILLLFWTLNRSISEFLSDYVLTLWSWLMDHLQPQLGGMIFGLPFPLHLHHVVTKEEINVRIPFTELQVLGERKVIYAKEWRRVWQINLGSLRSMVGQLRNCRKWRRVWQINLKSYICLGG